MEISKEQYWKLRALTIQLSECDLKRQIAQREFLEVAAKQNAHLQELGLDPQQQYRLNDETCEVTPMQPRPSLVESLPKRGRK